MTDLSVHQLPKLVASFTNEVSRLQESVAALRSTTAEFVDICVFLPGAVSTNTLGVEPAKCPAVRIGQAQPVKVISDQPGRPNLVVWCMENGDYILHFKDNIHGQLFVPHGVQMTARQAGDSVIDKDSRQTFRTPDGTLAKAFHSYVNVIAEYYEAAAGTPVKYGTTFVGRPPDSKTLKDFAMSQPEPIATASMMAMSYYEKQLQSVDTVEGKMLLYRQVISNCRTHINQLRTRVEPSKAPAEEVDSAKKVDDHVVKGRVKKKVVPGHDHKGKLRLQFKRQFAARACIGEY